MLSDIKILDLSTLLPGPYASMMLADLGAEVLRVESSTRTDLLREMMQKVGESSAAHQYLNRSNGISFFPQKNYYFKDYFLLKNR